MTLTKLMAAIPSRSVPRQDTPRRCLYRFNVRREGEADLVEEIRLRRNEIARYRAALVIGDHLDGNADQLLAGIAYQLWHCEQIVHEHERRRQARAYGYQEASGRCESDLQQRFAQAQHINTAELVRLETGQPGRRIGERWAFSCPFHGDGHERTPSFMVFEDGHAHCFACQVHATDAVACLALLRATTQVEALRLLESGVLAIGVPA
jgi:hypothetical protein